MEIPESLKPNESSPMAATPATPPVGSSINLINPSGDLVSMPMDIAREALNQGYEHATPEQVESHFNEEKYGTPEQMAKTFAEGAASGATFGLSTLGERALGISPEEITGRAKTNPLTRAIGAGAGIAASSLVPGIGPANVMEETGQAVAGLIPGASEAIQAHQALQSARSAGVGVEEAQAALRAAQQATPTLVKIGSQAANQATQFALMQSGDELSKMFASDPDQTLQSAITDIGLSGLLGGATGGVLGSVSTVWDKTLGGKAENFLNKLKNRVDGNSIPIGQEFETVLKGQSPELRAAFSEDPQIRNYYQGLIESGTSSGEAIRQTRDKFAEKITDDIKGALTPTEQLTSHEAGEKAKASILDTAEKMNQDVRGKYNEVQDISNVQVPDESRLKAYDSLIEKGQNFGAVGSEAGQLFKNYAERFLSQDTIGQQDKLITEIQSAKNVAYRAGDFEKSRALGEISEYIRDFQSKELDRQAMSLAKATGDENIIISAKLAQDQRADARSAYKSFMEKMGDIAQVGKLGKIKSYGQFQEALEKIPSSKFAERLFDKKNIEGLNYIKENFPEVFQDLVNQRKTDLLEAAEKSGKFSHIKAMNSINSLPNEVRSLMFNPQELQTIENSSKALRVLGERINPSGTARGVDTLWKHMPMGVGSAVSILTGHNPLVGALVGEAAQVLGRNAPDAIKLSLIKFLGSSGEVDASAWKSLVTYAEKAERGQRLIERSVKNVFGATGGAGIEALTVKKDDLEKLDKKLKDYQDNPNKLFEQTPKYSAYADDHNTAYMKTASNAVNYLNSQRPNNPKMSPLDSEQPLTFAQKTAWNRTLSVAEQPLVVMNHIKQGTLLPSDIKTMQNLYPDLYKKLSSDIQNQMIESVHKEEKIPYQTRQSLSLFLGTPLDSSFTPQSIMSSQSVFMAKNQVINNNAQNGQPRKNTAKMDKMSHQYQTATQSAQERQLEKS